MFSNAKPFYLTEGVIFTDEQLRIELAKRDLDFWKFKDYVAIKSRAQYGYGTHSFHKNWRPSKGAMPEQRNLALRDWKRIIYWAGEFAAANGKDWPFVGGSVISGKY